MRTSRLPLSIHLSDSTVFTFPRELSCLSGESPLYICFDHRAADPTDTVPPQTRNLALDNAYMADRRPRTEIVMFSVLAVLQLGASLLRSFRCVLADALSDLSSLSPLSFSLCTPTDAC